MIRSAFAAGFAFAIGVGAIPAAHAGLLDFLFGPSDRVESVNPNVPSDFRRSADVHPVVMIHKASHPAPRRIVRLKAAPTPALTPREQLAATIDPAKNPNWYLQDQTLRKGDILVLNDRVLVFKGGRIGEPASYVALKQTRLLSRKERARVAQMTGPERSNRALAAAAPEQPRKPIRSAEIKRAAVRG